MTIEDAPAFAVDTRHEDSAVVVALTGELEFGTAAAMRAALVDVTHDDSPTVVVDLGGVEFIDSTGLSLLVQAKQRFEAQGRRYVLRKVPDRVRSVLDRSGLIELFVLE